MKTTSKALIRKLTGLIDEIKYRIVFLFPRQDLIILDDLYPHPLSVFRNIEFKSYTNTFKKVHIYSSGDALGAVHDKRTLIDVIKAYDPNTLVLTHHKLLKSKLIYSLFLNITHAYLPYIERNKVPFVFTLYPGGGFYLNQSDSDKRLKRIFASPYFRKVIVTQKITQSYLLDNNFCPPECIEFIYGVVSAPMNQNIWNNKKLFGIDKQTFDICFIANKNMAQGYDKGYDLFIESLKILSSKFTNIKVHVVGPYSEKDCSTVGIKDIVFHGFINHDKFELFFKDKDIILSPNRPFALKNGAFDGFPTASCTEASANGVAMFISDVLEQNLYYRNGEDCVFIENDPIKISESIETYLKEPDKLYTLAQAGLKSTQNIYSYENQIISRINILKAEMKNF